MLAGSVVVGCAALVVVGMWRLSSGQAEGRAITQAYYSDDDGKTYFADALGKTSPFDHNGKPAYQAFVFHCPASNQPFVGYLLRKNELPQLSAHSTADAAKAAGRGHPAGIELKKPGTGGWVPASSPQAPTIAQPSCPDGGRAELVLPGV